MRETSRWLDLNNAVDGVVFSLSYNTMPHHLAVLHRGRFHRGEHLLVVLDVMLPGLNGFEVLRRLRDGAELLGELLGQCRHVDRLALDGEPARKTRTVDGAWTDVTAAEFLAEVATGPSPTA